MRFVAFTTESEDSPGHLAGKIEGGNHAEETEEAVSATDSGSSPGDLAGKIQGGNHAEETEEAVAATYSGSSLNTRAIRIEGGRHASGKAKDDGNESPSDKMIFLASNVPKYDDSDDHEQEGDDDRVKSNDTDKNRAKDLAGVPPFDPERANRNSLIFLSLLLLVAMPIVLWRYFSQPLVVVWRLSLLLCCCCTIWAALLAVTLPTETMLLRLGFVFMLALYIDCALDPKIAVLVPYLNSHFAVGMLGYALAERRQHDGVEVSAATVGIPSGEKEADRLFCAQFLGGAYIAVITAGYAAAVAYWVVWHAADFSVENLVMTVFLPLSGVLVLWITFVGAMLLRGALIGEIGFSALITYLVVMTMLCVMFAMTMGDTWAMVLGWPLMLALSGVFGYCICVYDTFKLRMRLGLGLPPVKPDESKEDSMSILLEKQGHGGDDLHPGNNVVDCSFSPEVAGVKSKIA